jgi:hypothetical protein
MSLTLKFLEKQAGTLSRTAIANLGGLITSESTGYAGSNCSVELVSTGNHHWSMLGIASTIMELVYTTGTACVENHKIYVTGKIWSNVAVDTIQLIVYGTTGGGAEVASEVYGGDYQTISGIYTLDGTFSGDIKLAWRIIDSDGVTGTYGAVYEWTAIDLTAQFGAGDEPDAADLDAFFAWRWEGWTNKVYGLHNANGDYYHLAQKIASHGLEYNDVVHFEPFYEGSFPYSRVYPLNDDWIITADSGLHGDLTAEVDVSYWTKTEHKPKAKTLRADLRQDSEGSISASFTCTSTWSPKLGAWAFLMDDTEYLFSGYVANVTTTKIDSTHWQCDCVFRSQLTKLQWGADNFIGSDLLGKTTQEAIDDLVMLYANWNASDGGRCFWRGNVDEGLASVQIGDGTVRSQYDMVSSLCKSAGLVMSVTGDGKFCAQNQSVAPVAAPRNITDAVSPDVWDMVYSEDISDYGNISRITGGYTAGGEIAYNYYAGTGAVTDADAACNANKTQILTDKAITNNTDAETVATLYYNRFGKVIPGKFSFTTTDLDYRPGQKISVDIDCLGMTAAKSMFIESVILYDADGVNDLANVVCVNRDSTDFAAAPNVGSSDYMASIASKTGQSVSAVTQEAGTFTPVIAGTNAGSYTYDLQSGKYLRHGNMCYINIALMIQSALNSPNGPLSLSGLPFAALYDTQLLAYTHGVEWGAGITDPHLYISAGNKFGAFYVYNNYEWGTLDASVVLENDVITISGWYQIWPGEPDAPPVE